jgi:NitT/TauT family transport system substrate-binding protein
LRTNFIEKNPDLIQRFVNAIYKAQLWVDQHSAEDIAAVIAPSFPDTDINMHESSIQRYKDKEAYALTPYLKEEAFEKLQTVMSEAGELRKKRHKTRSSTYLLQWRPSAISSAKPFAA